MSEPVNDMPDTKPTKTYEERMEAREAKAEEREARREAREVARETREAERAEREIALRGAEASEAQRTLKVVRQTLRALATFLLAKAKSKR